MGNEEKKYTTIHYHQYLAIDKITNAQNLRSIEVGQPAHEEMLFIIVHQVYELWFKQIIHELSSVIDMFKDDKVDERNIGTATDRLNRINEIQKLLIQQIRILETMTPLDFLDFRNYLFPASGFQSMQFREIEILLGLPEQQRITYNNHHYAAVFSEEQKASLANLQASGSLFEVVEKWLERTPFIKFGDFKFLESYQLAVKNMLDKEKLAIENSQFLNEHEKEMRLAMLGNTDSYFQSVFKPEVHEALRKEGKLRFGYNATLAALLINLYRDEPILKGPFNLLTKLVEIDQNLTTWRYRHAQMVLRILGKKIGTGGSSGHDYLEDTAKKHHIFTDLHNISTLLIPRSELPILPDEVSKQLGFYFSRSGM